MTIKNRITSPTPAFFRRLRKWGLIMAGAGTAIMAAPIALPTVLLTAAGYLAVAGGVTVAVSQAATISDGGDIN